MPGDLTAASWLQQGTYGKQEEDWFDEKDDDELRDPLDADN
jgi:hypothetical protein